MVLRLVCVGLLSCLALTADTIRVDITGSIRTSEVSVLPEGTPYILSYSWNDKPLVSGPFNQFVYELPNFEALLEFPTLNIRLSPLFEGTLTLEDGFSPASNLPDAVVASWYSNPLPGFTGTRVLVGLRGENGLLSGGRLPGRLDLSALREAYLEVTPFGPAPGLSDAVGDVETIQVSAIPEPATWMLVGCALTGLSRRRRKRLTT
jgi:hypothetical protein